MPSNENTDVLPAIEKTSEGVELEPLPDTTEVMKLESPITDTSLLELPDVKTEEVCLDMLNEVLEKNKDLEIDDSFTEEGSHKYIKLIIVLVIVLLLVVTAIVLKLLHVF